LSEAYLTVADSKTEAGEGRTIPLNTSLVDALVEYSKWYTARFGIIQPDWYVFAFGKPWPQDPTRPVVTLKTAWGNVRKSDMAGHVSKQMLRHYSHIGMEAKRRAVQALVSKKAVAAM